MSSQSGPTGESRPRTLHSSRSFTRMESPSSTTSSPRKRANTTQIPAIPEARPIDASPETTGSQTDVFENREGEEPASPDAEQPTPELQIPSTMDELPIEIRSLTERFLESLSAKVHRAPLSAETLSDTFQDFYERAASQISVHIATLASRLGRKDSTPAASIRSNRTRARAGSNAKRNGSPASVTSGGEMLTVSEVSDRKKARKMLEIKRVALEEAVERGVCEKLYEKLWKHRTSDDDARDEKLRSRIAALSLVGIGLKELHVEIAPADETDPQSTKDKEAEIQGLLAPARDALLKMDNEQYPLGKLQHLMAAHKSIVETLSQLFPSSSSADEILPTLIYTLITSAGQKLNVVSNLSFIQRFRAMSKVDGESAYCLVNLEAAISFLETVDLSSLRADELPGGPARSSSRPSTPTTEPTDITQPQASHTLKPEVAAVSATAHDTSIPDAAKKPLATATNAMSRPPLQHRRLSSMVQAQADRFEASRENVLQAADKVFDSVNGTLENSLKSLFGRFKDQVPDNPITLPKTLEEARRLVSPPAPEDEDLTSNGSGHSTPDPLSNNTRTLDLMAGRRRDRSADSTTSSIASASNQAQQRRASALANRTQPQASTSPVQGEPLNAAANFITSINPLNRFGVPSFPRFGRAASNSGTGTPTTNAAGSSSRASASQTPVLAAGGAGGAQVESPASLSSPLPSGNEKAGAAEEAEDDLNAAEALAELRKIRPPKKRFLEVGSAGELRLGEVEELLGEYRRLAKAIGEAVAQ